MKSIEGKSAMRVQHDKLCRTDIRRASTHNDVVRSTDNKTSKNGTTISSHYLKVKTLAHGTTDHFSLFNS
jgi:ethanolamine utilization protein EutQ (cupin superfamily)